MSGMEIAYLSLAVGSMVVFCLTLAWAIVSNRTDK